MANEILLPVSATQRSSSSSAKVQERGGTQPPFPPFKPKERGRRGRREGGEQMGGNSKRCEGARKEHWLREEEEGGGGGGRGGRGGGRVAGGGEGRYASPSRSLTSPPLLS